MSAIFFLIGCSVVLAIGFLAAFFWANKSGQNEDTYTPSVRILFDDELRETSIESENEMKKEAETQSKDTAPPLSS